MVPMHFRSHHFEGLVDERHKAPLTNVLLSDTQAFSQFSILQTFLEIGDSVIFVSYTKLNRHILAQGRESWDEGISLLLLPERVTFD